MAKIVRAVKKALAYRNKGCAGGCDWFIYHQL